MNSHLKLIETEFPDVIKRRMFQRDESAVRALALKGMAPPEIDWHRRYETWREYAQSFPNEFRVIVLGYKDSPSFIDMAIDLEPHGLDPSRCFSKRNLPDLLDFLKQDQMSLEELIKNIFYYNINTWGAFFKVDHPDRETFCNQVWTFVISKITDPYLLFRAAIITSRSKDIVLQYCKNFETENDFELMMEGLYFCLAYPYNQALTIELITRLVNSGHYKLKQLLICACDEGDLGTVRYLVENTEAKEQLTDPLFNGQIFATPLLCAISGNSINGTNLQLVSYLLDNGSDVVAPCATMLDHETIDDEITPLNQAIYSGNKELVGMLLAHYIRQGRINEVHNNGFQILHIVCQGKAAETLHGNQWLDVNNPHDGCDDYIRYLLKNGAREQINVKTENDEYTPLHLAVSNHGVKSIQLLVELGAEVNARSASQKTPLFKAYDAEVMEYLITHGADIFARDDQDRTALQRLTAYFCCRNADFSCMITLAQLSLSLMPLEMNKEDCDQWIDYWQRASSCYRYFNKFGFSLDLQLLTAIATRQSIKEIQFLIKAGAKVTTTIAHPHTAQSIAALLGTEEIIAYINSLSSAIARQGLKFFDEFSPDDGESTQKRLKY